jgi:hypothetical protein
MTAVPLKQKDLFTKRWSSVRVRDPLEDQIQTSLVAHLHLRCRPGVIWFHVPNGGYRYKTTGAWLKAMGVRAGVADLIFIWKPGVEQRWEQPEQPPHMVHVLCLELKVRGKKQRPEQEQFQTECGVVGAIYEMADNIDDALAIVKKYGIIP